MYLTKSIHMENTLRYAVDCNGFPTITLPTMSPSPGGRTSPSSHTTGKAREAEFNRAMTPQGKITTGMYDLREVYMCARVCACVFVCVRACVIKYQKITTTALGVVRRWT